MSDFALWLEFEEAMLWDTPTNDFSNIAVDLLDGRRYSINIWTFDYLATSVYCDGTRQEGGRGLYQIPPDLFVRELSRDCVHQAIADLLEQGEIEELLNDSVFGLNYVSPWFDILETPDVGASLKAELLTELAPEHTLYGWGVELLARREDCDDVLVELDNGHVAVVQLTWKGRPEQGGFPRTELFWDKKDFWRRKMKNDIIEFQQ